MLNLENLIPQTDGLKAMQFLQQLRTRQPRPIEEMTEIQTRGWLMVQDLLNHFQMEEPLRGLLLKMVDTFSDEQWLNYLRGLVDTANYAQDVLNQCGGES